MANKEDNGFWNDDTEEDTSVDSGRGSQSKHREAVHTELQQDGVFPKAEIGADDTYAYTSSRLGLKLRNAQGSTASLASLDETLDDCQVTTLITS